MGPDAPNSLTLFLLAWILIVLVSIAFILTAMKDSPSIEIVVEISDRGFDRNTAYAGAATIFGLAAFGSLFGVVVERGFASVVLSKKEALAMYGGLTVAIIAQGLLMLNSCCLGFYWGSVFMLNVMTMGAVTAAVLGVANVIGRIIRERQGRGEATDT